MNIDVTDRAIASDQEGMWWAYLDDERWHCTDFRGGLLPPLSTADLIAQRGPLNAEGVARRIPDTDVFNGCYVIVPAEPTP